MGYSLFKKGGNISTMKISKTVSSIKQNAYARRVWSGQGITKNQIARDVGYSPAVANSVVSKIESRPGFNNAMARLASDSGNIALAAMHELKSRGFQDFSNSELISSLNAISAAWDRFNKGLVESQKPEDNGKNRLRTVILGRLNNSNGDVPAELVTTDFVEVKENEPILDF